MFIGHAAVGFASKAAAPRVSLGVLLAAPFLLDLLWPVFVLTGIESARIDPGNTAFTPIAFDSYPWSHSLLMAVLWGALFGFLVHLAVRSAAAGAVVALGVVSHWICDAVVHRPDLPLTPERDGLRRHGPLELEGRDARRRAAALRARRLDLRAHDPPEGRGRPLGASPRSSRSSWSPMRARPSAPRRRTSRPSPGWASPDALLIPWAVWIDRHREAETLTP